jgi:lysophospholipase L1-like esterase
MSRFRSASWRLGANLALALGSAVVALVLAEAFLRFQEPYFRLTGDRAEWALGRYQGHSVWHHWVRPNRLTGVVSLHAATNPDPIIYRSNSLGCRDDREFASPASQGTYRIVVLGDSFTEGYHREEGFAGVLERRLNESGHLLRYEVINCGTSSYSPTLHYLRYRHQLSELRADEVIVNIDLTDVFDDNVRYRNEVIFDEGGEPVSAGPPRFSRAMIADELRFRYYLARLVLGNPRSDAPLFTKQDLFAFHDGQIAPDSDAWQTAVDYTIGMLERLAELTRESGTALTLSMYPYREQFQSVDGGPIWHRAFEQRVAEFAADADLSFYSAWDDLAELFEQSMPLYWHNDFHFTYFGQRAWSEAFASHYLRHGAGLAAASSGHPDESRPGRY